MTDSQIDIIHLNKHFCKRLIFTWQILVSCVILRIILLLRIDHKLASSSYGYMQHEAQAILKEVRTIKDAISSGEREKQELMQVKVNANLPSLYSWN